MTKPAIAPLDQHITCNERKIKIKKNMDINNISTNLNNAVYVLFPEDLQN
jgi:hypothetical protein